MHNSKHEAEGTKAKPWAATQPPKRVLVIRLQAMGDVVITLPYIQQLRNSLPAGTRLDLLTRKETDPVPKNLHLFNKVFSIGGGRIFKKQFIYTCTMLPLLLLQRYQVVIDLQNNMLSRLVTKTVRPRAWSVFDRFAPLAAGERYRMTIDAAGMGPNRACFNLTLKHTGGIENTLRDCGWDGESTLVILNPAGAFATRNWALPNYVAFAKLWLAHNPKTQFVMTGVSTIEAKARYFKEELGSSFINLVNKTSAAQAFEVVKNAAFVLSEDSGLMHMAWVQGRPVLALFGSTRSDWSRPLGPHSVLMGSSDLPCGSCLLEVCARGDVYCLTRYTPEMVFERAVSLLQAVSSGKQVHY